MIHRAVLKDELVGYLGPKEGDIVIDATVGCGGHAAEIARRIGPGGVLIGIDRDEEALSEAREALSDSVCRVELYHGNFSGLKEIAGGLGVKKADCVLFDLGVSSLQLDRPERGFSIIRDGPLDMRMDRSRGTTAADIVNRAPETALAEIFRKYGEERLARRIASRIVKERRRGAISTTGQLARIVTESLPYSRRHRRIHPATKVFMALRVAVNGELDELEAGLNDAVSMLQNGGRVGVISFHSLEDRIAKNVFREFAQKGALKILTKKPVTASDPEVTENLRARSAKLRAAVKISP